MNPRYGRRRSSHGSSEDEDPFIDAPQVVGDDSRSDERHHNQINTLDNDSRPETRSFADDSGVEFKDWSQTTEKMRWWKVYALHFLFMWNTKTYEYATIVLVSLAFPKTLLATSIRGITSTLSAMLCASAVGSWIDNAPSRLPPLLVSISSNHGAIVASYLCWLVWPLMVGYGGDNNDPNVSQTPFFSLSKGFLYGFILLLDVIHDLSAIGNRLSIERDWVPALVGPITADTTYGLTHINAVMRRIDLICKLVAPSFLPLIISYIQSQVAWIILLIVVTILMWGLELSCAHIIAKENPQLRLPKATSNNEASREDLDIDDQYHNIKPGFTTWAQKLYFISYRGQRLRFKQYFSMSVWPASISISILQMTVLAYSATLITYLLEVGFSLSAITIARASGSIMALSGTFITPFAVGYLRKRYLRAQIIQACEIEGTVVRTVGLWGVSSQFICMIPVVIVLWNLSPLSPEASSSQSHASDSYPNVSMPPPHLISFILFSFLSLTRIGHWMYDLMIQELEQVEVPSSQRSTFAGTEHSFRSFFELCHWAATVIWNRPEEFKWLAQGSLVVLGVGAAIFAFWRRKEDKTSVHPRYDEIAMDDIT